MGIPRTMAMRVQTAMIAMVRIVSSHMPKRPIATKATTTATASASLRLAAQARPTATTMTIHQGRSSRKRSNQIMKWSSGSKKASIESPQARENSRYPSSMLLRSVRSSSRGSAGNSNSQPGCAMSGSRGRGG